MSKITIDNEEYKLDDPKTTDPLFNPQVVFCTDTILAQTPLETGTLI